MRHRVLLVPHHHVNIWSQRFSRLVKLTEIIMSLGLFPEQDENSIYFSRKDETEPMSSYSAYKFELDGFEWPTVEHYFQAMKFADDNYQKKIREAKSPAAARKLGRSRLKRIRKDWRSIREVVMTRAVYIQSRTHVEVAEAILKTGDARLVENNQYDYFWGCGRDRRGRNAYGRVLMGVRKKLQKELEPVE